MPPELDVEPLRRSVPEVGISALPQVTIVSNAAIPRQLPPPPSDFVGRKADISRLVDAVRQRGATISGVRGLGGIGKTALALVVANNLAVDFPVGQIYLDLKGAADWQNTSGVPPLTAQEAMDHIIHSFNPLAKIPSTDSEREGLYRTTLNGKRVLLLIDNALNHQQVERLIPPASCVMIVTSREHFTLPGMLAHDLATLSVDEARDLLLRIEPRITDTADKIAKLCGYLPKALRAVASILVNAPHLSPTDVLRQMSDARRRLSLTGVELALATSSELLTSDLRDHWFQLGVFPATFDNTAAAAIWGTHNENSGRILSLLLRYSLIEFDSAHRRFYLHDLVRDFTLSRLGKSSAALARFRHSVYFLDILASASFLYGRGETGIALGLGMFDAERLNIEAGQRWAANHAPATKDAARLCLEYSDVGASFLRLRIARREQVAWLTTGIKSVARLTRLSWHRRQVFEAEVRLLTELADVLIARGQIEEAIKPLIRSIERLQDLHLERSALRQLVSLGDILRISGRLKDALQIHSIVYKEVFEYGDVIYEIAQKGMDARGHVTDVFRYLNAINRGESTSRILLGVIAASSLGKDWLALRKPHRAMTYFSMQLDLATHSGDLHNQAVALSHLGIAHGLLNHYRRAIEFHDKSRIIAERLRDKDSEANFLFNTARAYIGLEDRVAAISTAENALKLYEKMDSRYAEEVRSFLQECGKLKNAKSSHRSSPAPGAEVASSRTSPGMRTLMKTARPLLWHLIESQ